MSDDAVATVLITGGAGFIGSHITDELLRHGYHVKILDNLTPRVHGVERRRPEYLDPQATLIVGDVRDAHSVQEALEGVDAVIHLAAAVGMRQSMYNIEQYASTNSLGTAVLLEELIRRPVQRLVVGSSSSIYGEGLYGSLNGGVYTTIRRTADRLGKGDFEPHSPDGEVLYPLPTPEAKEASPQSVYALSKYDQEKMCRIVGDAYGMQAVSLRLFNVYGPRQGFANHYTGALTDCAVRLLMGEAPLLFEDGNQQRDFVHVSDVAAAFRLALEVPEAAGSAFNIGSGLPHTFRSVAATMAAMLGKTDSTPLTTGTHRIGEVRHCFADISRAREILGYAPAIPLAEGVADLASWVAEQMAQEREQRLQQREVSTGGMAI
ncbi:SDR family NAD(P)-dependent oxidoreductase [Methanoculleus sp. FWC-SCC1]|uniref:SDR family NAD(P)-dependent oxidoreductase n=1 Tax=Methanoculleus frigidifontis TaxID=2584085 RepID=A0ABT8MB73_9EURY|nr:SDR family NAD(P)-dependent oxidoreductase [Methanoculleus sp. FWC-SCC1]MDN7025185.1 SDR family NAD(P)-dependent oxidoreductase [Methanoculleus sp. FWC-SCC1]